MHPNAVVIELFGQLLSYETREARRGRRHRSAVSGKGVEVVQMPMIEGIEDCPESLLQETDRQDPADVVQSLSTDVCRDAPVVTVQRVSILGTARHYVAGTDDALGR